jgi:M6 family metalloprotease-like protein
MARTRALYVLIILVVLAPGLSYPVSGGPSGARVSYAPSFAMPLPTPPPRAILQPVPVSGVLRVLVIGAYFSDINYTVSISQLKQSFFTGVANYYSENSYGKLTIEGDAYGWYKLPYPQAHYGKDCLSIDDADCSGQDNSWEIAQDVVGQAEKDVNFANYNYFVFIHSGEGQESSGVKDQVWSVTYMGGIAIQTNAKTLFQFSIVPELEAGGAVPLGVWCHEFGHLLNLPDLFNTNTGQTILGPWSTMDEGTWNGNPPGSSPAHLVAWAKIQLGFISGSMLATANLGVTSTFTIDPTEVASSNVHAVEVPLGSSLNPSEYYLIEVRADIGFDSALPAFGVLITLVNNNAVVGPVHIIDGHPSVAGLQDAVWDVGQTFTDSGDGFSVSVTGKTGNSYQVTVNRGPAQPQQPQNQTQSTYIDLAITSITDQPSVITNPGTTVTITVQISDLGTQGATNVPVQVNLDNQTYTNTNVSVDSGSSTQTSFTWLSILGSHVFQITIDPNHTINYTDRANSVATFTIFVGPTLTINVPLNVTTTSAVWVSINGVRYNITTSSLQASVPNGTAVLLIQPFVNVSVGVRQAFVGWSDGSTQNPHQITVTGNTTLNAQFAMQYQLTIDPNGGFTTPTGWYYANTNVTVTATNPSYVVANYSRLVFDGWSGAVSSNSTDLQLTMNQPLSLTANWVHQYYVTVLSPPGTTTGSGWYNAGNPATISVVQPTVQFPNGTRQVFMGWNTTSTTENPLRLVVNSPTTVRGLWQVQYLVDAESDYGEATGSGWYAPGSTVQVSVNAEIEYPNNTRRMFTAWTGDYESSSPKFTTTVNAPMRLEATWETQYFITFEVNGLDNSTVVKLTLDNASYDLSAARNYGAWYRQGAVISPTVNATVSSGIMVYKMARWQNSTGGTTNFPLEVNRPQTYTVSYSSELSLPPVPGFPIEAIIVGLFLGLALGIMRRRTRAERKYASSKKRLNARPAENGMLSAS